MAKSVKCFDTASLSLVELEAILLYDVLDFARSGNLYTSVVACFAFYSELDDMSIYFQSQVHFLHRFLFMPSFSRSLE